MKLTLKLLALGATLAIVAAGSTAALAVDKDQVIKDRQALMKGIEQYASTLSHTQIAKARLGE